MNWLAIWNRFTTDHYRTENPATFDACLEHEPNWGANEVFLQESHWWPKSSAMGPAVTVYSAYTFVFSSLSKVVSVRAVVKTVL